jgi:hypothetical protein
MRATFKHSPIRDWAKETRAVLVRVLVRAWLVAGRVPVAAFFAPTKAFDREIGESEWR